MEKPILFSAPMVRAILEGRKTQTRRKIAFPPSTGAFVLIGSEDGSWWPFVSVDGESTQDQNGDERPMNCPYPVGSEMWVRETWQHAPSQFCHCPQPSEPAPCDAWSNGTGCASNRGAVIYKADGIDVSLWRPSIFMPRWASRITLKVTDVRVQRLQDISRDDAASEGLSWVMPTYGIPGAAGSWDADPRISYRWLWESINGTGSWDANPWVFAYTFERLR